MTAVKSIKAPRPIQIPSGSGNELRNIALTNPSLQEALTKRRQADLEQYGIPDKTSDVFRRRITIIKAAKDKAPPGDDMPDLEDAQLTDLPWVGYVTFNGANRQFRSKNRLAVVVEVVREFDGYLYCLAEGINRDRPTPLPVVLNVTPPTAWDAYWNVSKQKDLNFNEAMAIFKDVPAIPPRLAQEMMALGYVVEADGFSLPGVDGVGSKLKCELYGKLQYVRDTSVCLA